MPEYIIIRCFQCGTFQVQQRKKAPKWKCTLCGAQQSLKKVFGVASQANQLRPIVQDYNMRRGEIEEEEKELALHSARQLQEDPDVALPAQISTPKSLPEEWEDYKDDPPHRDPLLEGDEEANNDDGDEEFLGNNVGWKNFGAARGRGRGRARGGASLGGSVGAGAKRKRESYETGTFNDNSPRSTALSLPSSREERNNAIVSALKSTTNARPSTSTQDEAVPRTIPSMRSIATQTAVDNVHGLSAQQQQPQNDRTFFRFEERSSRDSDSLKSMNQSRGTQTTFAQARSPPTPTVQLTAAARSRAAAAVSSAFSGAAAVPPLAANLDSKSTKDEFIDPELQRILDARIKRPATESAVARVGARLVDEPDDALADNGIAASTHNSIYSTNAASKKSTQSMWSEFMDEDGDGAVDDEDDEAGGGTFLGGTGGDEGPVFFR